MADLLRPLAIALTKLHALDTQPVVRCQREDLRDLLHLDVKNSAAWSVPTAASLATIATMSPAPVAVHTLLLNPQSRPDPDLPVNQVLRLRVEAGP
jgi:hypothetical protein